MIAGRGSDWPQKLSEQLTVQRKRLLDTTNKKRNGWEMYEKGRRTCDLGGYDQRLLKIIEG